MAPLSGIRRVRRRLQNLLSIKFSCKENTWISHNTLSTAQTLPDDVLVIVFAHLNPTVHSVHPDLRNSDFLQALVTCSLVCRSWNGTSSSILLREVFIQSKTPEEQQPLKAKRRFALSKSAHHMFQSHTVAYFAHTLSCSPTSRLRVMIRELHVGAETVDFVALQSAVMQLVNLRVFKFKCTSFALLDNKSEYTPPRTPRRSLELLSLHMGLIGITHPRMPQLLDVFLWFDACDTLNINTARAYVENTNLFRKHRPVSGKVSVHDMFVGPYDVESLLGNKAEEIFDFHTLTELMVRMRTTDAKTLCRFLSKHGNSLDSCDVVVAGGVFSASSTQAAQHNTSSPLFAFASCSRLHKLELTWQLSATNTTFTPSATALVDACLADAVAVLNLKSLTFTLQLTADTITPDFRTALPSFIDSIDWSLLDFEIPPHPSFDSHDREPPVITVKLQLSQSTSDNSAPEPVLPTLKAKCIDLVRAKFSDRTREAVKVI